MSNLDSDRSPVLCQDDRTSADVPAVAFSNGGLATSANNASKRINYIFSFHKFLLKMSNIFRGKAFEISFQVPLQPGAWPLLCDDVHFCDSLCSLRHAIYQQIIQSKVSK